MTVAEATPELDEVADRNDRAFIGHPKGLGYLALVEGCERFSYYSMQTLLVLYMVNYLLPERFDTAVGLGRRRDHGARPLPDGVRRRFPVRTDVADRRRRAVQGQHRQPGRRALQGRRP